MNRRQFLGCAAVLAAGCTNNPGKLSRVLVWGSQGTTSGTFLRPRAIGCFADEVYVIDTTGRVQVFDTEGSFRRTWSIPESDNGTPTAIHFGVDGTVYIPDTHYSRILEYDTEGKLKMEWGSYSSESGNFIYPTGLVRDSDGMFYISEYGQSAERIQVFDANRKFVRTWGSHGNKPGQFNRTMAIDIGTDGNLYTGDTANHRIQAYSKQGEYLRELAGAEQLKYPHDIAAGQDGFIYAAEYGAHRISRFAIDGSSSKVFGGPGREPGGFNGPRGVAVSAKGWVYVADTDNHRVQAFQADHA